MIEFQSVTVQNFLSVGNVPITISLNTHHITTVTGPSGSGKSLLITDALVFGIFGKPFRNINKPQLINSINQKNCLVTLTFNVNGCDYKVVRGIKPNIFEIYQNELLINQEADSRDYQKILEQQILKLNYKTFTQVVILGSANYIPFMQLTPLQRREVVENILDISIFSVMAQLLKDRFSTAKEHLNGCENDILITKNKITSQKKLIEVLVQSKQLRLNDINTKINTNINEINNTNVVLKQHNDELKLLEECLDHTVQKSITDIRLRMTQIETRIDTTNKQLSFFNTTAVCSLCTQTIHSDHKHLMDTKLQHDLGLYNTELKELQNELQQYEQRLIENREVNEKIRDYNIKIALAKQTIVLLTKDNERLRQELDMLTTDKTDINIEKTTLKTLATTAIQLIEEKTKLMEEIQLYTIASQLLKDDGIKTAIIKEYLPNINTLINYYLTILDLYVKFELDSSLNESVKSRGRDIFSYNSFSEGEKSRLSIALMLTWRTIAKSKGAVYTNLLILDEIFSQHLDPIGIQAVKDLLLTDLVDNNIFVITHTHVDEFKTISNQIIETKKVGDFSTIILE